VRRRERLAVGDVVAVRQTFEGGHMVARVVDVADHDLLVCRNIRGSEQFRDTEESVERHQIREVLHAQPAEPHGARPDLAGLWAAVDLWVADRSAPAQAEPTPARAPLSYRLSDARRPEEDQAETG
jgi:hypothetical protein